MAPARTLAEWLAILEAKHSSAIELGLDRVRVVAQRLALDFSGSCVITVAGTNGKGSSVAMLDTALRGAGFTTACYTSPHLQHFSERVQLQGVPADDALICEAFAAVEQATTDVALSWFEFTTLAILKLIAGARPDVCILEVGLGGRLDAVNIVDADIALITSIGIDHTEWLGDDRESIGFEKAGIFRAGAIAVCADPSPPDSIAAAAARSGAKLLQRGIAFDIGAGRLWRGVAADGAPLQMPLPELALADDNLAGVVQVLASLPLAFDRAAALAALQGLTLRGRQQRLRYRDIEVILDVAHNPDSVAALAACLQEKAADGRTFALFNAMADKPVAEMLGMMSPLIDSWWLCDLPDNSRAMSVDKLAGLLVPQAGAAVNCARSVTQAWAELNKVMLAGDRLVVFGSFYLVGPVLNILDTASRRRPLSEAKHA